MLKLCVLLLALAAPSLAKISCTDIPTVASVDFNQLRGQWVVSEWTRFRDGVLSTGTVAPPPASGRHVHCMTAKLENTTESGFTFKMTFLHADKEKVERSSELVRVGDSQGRLNIITDSPNMQNHQMLILDVNPAKYMALLHCQPEKGQDDVTKRVALHLSIMTRRQGSDGADHNHEGHGDHAPLTVEELEEVRSKAAQIIGAPDLELKKIDPSCISEIL